MTVSNNETLREKQSRFVKLLATLIEKAYDLGYELTLAEAYRPPELAKLYQQQGRGIANSLHTQRLAIDLNVFRQGQLLVDGSTFEALGQFWESIGGTWGGRFKDGNHFSLEHNGVK